MSNKLKKTDSPVSSLKNESARQRWELFHRAIAHAKECNHAAVVESDLGADEGPSGGPFLTIVR